MTKPKLSRIQLKDILINYFDVLMLLYMNNKEMLHFSSNIYKISNTKMKKLALSAALSLLIGSILISSSNGLTIIAYAQQPQPCIIPPAGMVSWWPGDGNANDIQGISTGIVNGNVSFVPGKVDQAFNFTGRGHIATLNSLPATNGSGTIDAWISVPSNPTSYQHVAGILNLLRLTVTNFGEIYGLATVNTSSGPLTLSTPTIFPVGTGYHHIAFVYDSDLGRGSIYLDGTVAGLSAPVPPGTRLVLSGQGGLTIGDIYAGGEAFVGSVDEVEIFNLALSQSQIRAIFDSDNIGKCKPPANQPPDCSLTYPSTSELWPPNHAMKNIFIRGVIDPEGDPITIRIISIFQDEPTKLNPGDQSPDGAGIGTSTAQVRAERLGVGDGRIYAIEFAADDGKGEMCNGQVEVSVPINQGQPAYDGAIFDSTQP